MITDIIRTREVVLLDAKADIRETADGYLVASPRVARTGIQIYGGSELGKPGMERVRVWRPADEVFHKDAMASVAHRPITNNHPSEAVTADNWKKYSVGQTGDLVARDGEFIRVPMVMMDAQAIRDVKGGKKELSLGYTSHLEWRAGKTPEGLEYDAVQTNIRVNHLAVVDSARGGPKLAIGDTDSIANKTIADEARKLISDGKTEKAAAMPSEGGAGVLSFNSVVPGICYSFAKDGVVYRGALVSIKAQADQQADKPLSELCDSLIKLIDSNTEEETTMTALNLRTLLVDAVNIELTDTAAQIVNRALASRDAEVLALKGRLTSDASTAKTALDAALAQVATLTTQVATKDAELVTTKKQLSDATITPARLDELVKDRAEVVVRARAILGDKLVVDGKTEGDMRKQVVEAKLGDSAKGWNDEMIKASFVAFTNDLKPEDLTQAADQMRATFSTPAGGAPSRSGGALPVSDARTKYEHDLQNAWKTPGGAQTQQ